MELQGLRAESHVRKLTLTMQFACGNLRLGTDYFAWGAGSRPTHILALFSGKTKTSRIAIHFLSFFAHQQILFQTVSEDLMTEAGTLKQTASTG